MGSRVSSSFKIICSMELTRFIFLVNGLIVLLDFEFGAIVSFKTESYDEDIGDGKLVVRLDDVEESGVPVFVSRQLGETAYYLLE